MSPCLSGLFRPRMAPTLIHTSKQSGFCHSRRPKLCQIVCFVHIEPSFIWTPKAGDSEIAGARNRKEKRLLWPTQDTFEKDSFGVLLMTQWGMLRPLIDFLIHPFHSVKDFLYEAFKADSFANEHFDDLHSGLVLRHSAPSSV